MIIILGAGIIGLSLGYDLLNKGKKVKIFDVYQGENITLGKKSIAFSVTFEPKDKTLSEKDIDEVSKKIISIVQETTGATLRS